MQVQEEIRKLERFRLPTERPGRIWRLSIGTDETVEMIVEHVIEEGVVPTPSKIKCFLITGNYPNGCLGEIFCVPDREGSLLKGLLDGFAQMVSVSLQYGIPLEMIVKRFTSTRFGPQGITNDAQIPMASSIFDLVFRKLALAYLTPEQCADLNIEDHSAKATTEEFQDVEQADEDESGEAGWVKQPDGSWLNVEAEAYYDRRPGPSCFSEGASEADREGTGEGECEPDGGGKEDKGAAEAPADVQAPEAGAEV